MSFLLLSNIFENEEYSALSKELHIDGHGLSAASGEPSTGTTKLDTQSKM